MEEQIVNKAGNKNCVVCGNKNPTWGCSPFGVLCCTRCSGGFRSLGTTVCKVKSLLLDKVDQEYLIPFEQGSNATFLKWYHKKNKEDPTPEYFQTPEAQEYLVLLREGKIKETKAATAPALELTRKHRNRLQLALDASEEEESPEETEKKKEPAQETYLQPEITRKSVRRTPGTITTLGTTKSLGMFRNTKEQEQPTGYFHSSHSTTISNNDSPSQPTEIVQGTNFIGSAEIPQESLADKLKKTLEKGKKSILKGFKK
ncbi:hypothetical protein NEOKW01_1466 [Nematocida sp. AWRm80]|nr:hypothetical protein NEOKW01_1466 [Nematocida sp. AWRm80]